MDELESGEESKIASYPQFPRALRRRSAVAFVKKVKRFWTVNNYICKLTPRPAHSFPSTILHFFLWIDWHLFSLQIYKEWKSSGQIRGQKG